MELAVADVTKPTGGQGNRAGGERSSSGDREVRRKRSGGSAWRFDEHVFTRRLS